MMFDHIRFAKDNGFFDDKFSDKTYKKALTSVIKLTGERDEKVIIAKYLDYLQDTYLDLLMSHFTESGGTMNKNNNDLLNKYINGSIDQDGLIKEYETWADVVAKTDNTSGKTNPKVNTDIDEEDEDGNNISEDVRAKSGFKIIGDDNIVPDYFSHLRTVPLIIAKGFQWLVSYETERGGTTLDIYTNTRGEYRSVYFQKGASRGTPYYFYNESQTAAHIADMLFSYTKFNKVVGDPFRGEYYIVLFDSNPNLITFVSIDDFKKLKDDPHILIKGEVTLDSVMKGINSLK